MAQVFIFGRKRSKPASMLYYRDGLSAARPPSATTLTIILLNIQTVSDNAPALFRALAAQNRLQLNALLKL